MTEKKQYKVGDKLLRYVRYSDPDPVTVLQVVAAKKRPYPVPTRYGGSLWRNETSYVVKSDVTGHTYWPRNCHLSERSSK